MKVLKNQDGFSLIEVVISLGVLGIGILSMYTMQLHSIKGNSKANKVTSEVSAAVDGFEQLYTPDMYYMLEELGNVTVKEQEEIITYMDGNQKPATQTLSFPLKDDNYEISFKTTEKSPLVGLTTIDVTIKNIIDNKELTFQYVKIDPKFPMK